MTKKKWIILISIIAWLAIILAIYKFVFFDPCVSKCEKYWSILACDYQYSCEHVCIFSPGEYSCN